MVLKETKEMQMITDNNKLKQDLKTYWEQVLNFDTLLEPIEEIKKTIKDIYGKNS